MQIICVYKKEKKIELSTVLYKKILHVYHRHTIMNVHVVITRSITYRSRSSLYFISIVYTFNMALAKKKVAKKVAKKAVKKVIKKAVKKAVKKVAKKAVKKVAKKK